MRRLITVLLALFVVVPPLAYQPAVALESDVPDEAYPVIFLVDEDEYLTSHANRVMTALDIPREQFTARIAYKYEYAVHGYSLLLTAYEARRAEMLFGEEGGFGIESIHPDTTTFSLPDSPGGFEIQGARSDAFAGREVVPFGIQRVGAPDQAYPDVDVAIVDTGTDRYNAELDVVGGVDCVSDDRDEYGVDQHGHGTFVGSLVGAKMDGRGIVGMAPGARLWSVRVLDGSGSGSMSSVLCGVDWIAEHADVIDVANFSLGGGNAYGDTACGGPDALHTGICTMTDLGVLAVVAAGNANDDASKYVPAAYSEVVTVSAIADWDGMPGGFALAPNAGCTAMSLDDRRASFSNYGEHVDIGAPGTCILGAYLDGEYAYSSGTSFASPITAGCAARYLSQHPDQPAYAWEQILASSKGRGEFVAGAYDATAEPMLWCGDLQRYSGD